MYWNIIEEISATAPSVPRKRQKAVMAIETIQNTQPYPQLGQEYLTCDYILYLHTYWDIIEDISQNVLYTNDSIKASINTTIHVITGKITKVSNLLSGAKWTVLNKKHALNFGWVRYVQIGKTCMLLIPLHLKIKRNTGCKCHLQNGDTSQSA